MTLREYRQLSAPALVNRLELLLTHDRANLTEILVCIGEIESRKHYVAAGYPTMHAYCVGVFHMSSDEAYKRVRAARAGRRHPLILKSLAAGRLHLTAVTLLAKHLTHANVSELVEAATHRTKHEVQLLIAQRFPIADVPTSLREVATAVVVRTASPESGLQPSAEQSGSPTDVNASQETLVPEPIGAEAGSPFVLLPVEHHAIVTPLAPTRIELRCTISHEAHDDLRAIQELMSHASTGIDPAKVVELALRELRARLEKQKFAATDRPRSSKRESVGRYIPNQVRREVNERDGNQCSFVGNTGHRCAARILLEYDHIRPIACGGKSTTHNLRLRCRAHNQHEAEQLFGEAFMQERRAEARSRPAGSRAQPSTPFR